LFCCDNNFGLNKRSDHIEPEPHVYGRMYVYIYNRVHEYKQPHYIAIDTVIYT